VIFAVNAFQTVIIVDFLEASTRLLQRSLGSGMRFGLVRHTRRSFGKDVLNALKTRRDLSQHAHPAQEFKDQDEKEGEEDQRTEVVKHGEFSKKTKEMS
jgi:hypothetical protein